MAKNGTGFSNALSSPWMANAICENPEKFYGETALGPAGRMVNGHGYATLSTGERVPITSFMVNYQKQTWVPTGIRNFRQPGKPQWRQPICEVVRYDLRYAPKFQEKYKQVKVNKDNPSGAKLVRQDY